MSGLFRRSARILCFFAAVLVVMFSISGAVASSESAPSKIRLTWSRDNTSSSINVTWWTTIENSGDELLYDNESHNGIPENYAYSATGIHHTSSGFKGYIHDVEITGLEPDTT